MTFQNYTTQHYSHILNHQLDNYEQREHCQFLIINNID